jgi:hypothetical protein
MRWPLPLAAQRWLSTPAGSQMWIWARSAVLPSSTSSSLPDCGLSSVPSGCGCHTWAALPLQVYSCTSVPLAVPPPSMSRHLPSARNVPPTRLHRCATVPLQVYSWIFVWSAVPALSTSRHLPPVPRIGPPPPPRVSASRLTCPVSPLSYRYPIVLGPASSATVSTAVDQVSQFAVAPSATCRWRTPLTYRLTVFRPANGSGPLE